MKTCTRCPNQFEPIRPTQRVCAHCAVLGMASLMEETSPEDSLADISAGEQAGAYLRNLVKKPEP